MKNIEEFLAAHFLERLERHQALVVYDPEKRFGSVVNGLSEAGCRIVDASGSTIKGREEAMEAWLELGRHPEAHRGLIVYLPVRKPMSNEERRGDPFQVFALGGGEFPLGDGESWQELCQQANPGKTEQINRLFSQGVPDFDVINHLMGEGSAWPKLQSILNVESMTEILTSVLSPTPAQKNVLERDGEWLAELNELLRATFQFSPAKGAGNLQAIQDELARLLLFSEFVFDLPGTLPEALIGVPRVPPASRDLVYKICDTLRGTEAHQERYMAMAEETALALNLEAHFPEIQDLGARDTFPFEERTFLQMFITLASAGKYSEADAICQGRERSIWVKLTERQQLWSIARRVLALLRKAEDLEPRLKSVKPSLPALWEFYVDDFRTLDTCHREFEQAVGDAFGNLPGMEKLVEVGRERYLSLAEALQKKLLVTVQKEGWPVSGVTRHIDVFRKYVAPWLEERRKVVLFMVDALRFELAVALEKHLANNFKVTTNAVCAQLPTITTVGMAALLPEADTDFRVTWHNEEAIPAIKGTLIKTPDERMKWAQTSLGDMCHMIDLDSLLTKPWSKLKVPETTRLLVIKSGEIDQLCENTPGEGWRMMPQLLRKLLAGIKRTAGKGFQKAVIASDHGFFLTEPHETGDVAPKPPGDWKAVKDRCLLGKGSPAAGTLVFPACDIGITGDFECFAVPASLATFTKGVGYFHAGLSMQECVLPVLSIDLGPAGHRETAAVKIHLKLGYRGGLTKKITTRRPMIEIALMQGDLFDSSVFQFQLSAWSGKIQVGDVITCSHIDPSTGLVAIRFGESLKIPFRMAEEFGGAFEIRATDPTTGVIHDKLTLETDYAE